MTITREMIISELQRKGYDAELQTNIKNGVEFDGIRIVTDNNICPVVYTDGIINKAMRENKGIDDVVEEVINIFENNKSIDFDIKELFERNFLFDNTFVGLQRESNEELVKGSCELAGIESYLYIKKDKDNGDGYSVKLNKAILENAEVSEEELWKQAEENTKAESTIQSLAKVMAEMYGEECTEEMEEKVPLYVISNKSKVKGASAVLNKEMLAEFGKKNKVEKIVVLPSSIHEMLILPYTDDTNLDYLSAMVREVNLTNVAPEERLTDRAYLMAI